jgi:MazG family protein
MPGRRQPRRPPSRKTADETLRLVQIMATLRQPGGCPWDRKQTHKSLVPYLIEETYELKEALLSGKNQRMLEELGDLLLQVVFHAQLGSERGAFDFALVARAIADKLVRRHPHVFGRSQRKLSAEQVVARWEHLKLAEKQGTDVLLGGVPRALPALLRAYRIQEKVAQFGFDWPDVGGVERKLREETDEFHRALGRRDRRAQTEELGDLLFTLVNLSRHLGVDPETALQTANDKFAKRFSRMERLLRNRGIPLSECSLEMLEGAWQEAKKARVARVRPPARGRGGRRR